MRVFVLSLFISFAAFPVYGQSDDAKRPAPATDAGFAGYPSMTSSKEVAAYVAGEGVRFVFQWHPACPGSAPAWKSMMSRAEIRALPIAVWRNEESRPFPGTGLSDALSFPSLMVYRDGVPVMTLYGWQTIHVDQFLPDFLARANGGPRRFYSIADSLAAAKDTYAARAFETGPRDAAAIKWFVERQPWYPWSLYGADLSRLDFSRSRAFTGANLRNANFEGARFDDVDFSGADLTGANFTDTSLLKVFWGEAICPDGTRSRDHGYSCRDNLVSGE